MTMTRIIRPLIITLLIVPPLVFFTDLTRNPYYFQIVLLNSLTVFLGMLWVYAGMRAGTIELRRTPADLPLLVFLVVATLSWAVALAAHWGEPYLRYGVYSEGLKRWLYVLVNAALPFWLAVQLIDDRNRSGAVRAVFITAWIASAYGVLQYFGIELIWPKVLNPYGGRCVSTFGNPNFLSSYLVLVLPVAFARWATMRPSLSRVGTGLLLLTCLGALLSTLTRSSWLGLVAGATICVLLLARFEPVVFRARRRALIIAGLLLLVLTAFWPRSRVEGYSPSFVERLRETTRATTSYYGSWHQRRLIWSCAWHMVREHPIVGRGWGCFELFYPFYQGRHLFLDAYHGFRTHANNAHNEFLEIWSQTGTLGFGIYLWLLAVLFTAAWRTIAVLAGDKRIMAIGLAAGAVGMLVDNLLNVSLHFAVPGFLYWWQWGLLLGLAPLVRSDISLTGTVRRAFMVLACVLGVLLIARYACNFAGEINYFAGFKHSKRNELTRAIPALERAHRLQRFEVNNNYELANCYARAGMRDRAVALYEESLRSNAGYDEIYFNLATVLAQRGEFTRSIREYTRALYINPLSFDAYTAMGSIFLQDPVRYDRAGIALFTQCARFFPENKDVWNNLGYLHTKMRDDEQALGAYRHALMLDPDFALARRNLSVTLARLGRRDPAMDAVDALFAVAERAIRSRDWPTARARCEELLSRVPESLRARLYLANVLLSQGYAQEAIAQYGVVLSRDPRNPSALANRAMAHMALRRTAAARADLLALRAIDPESQVAREYLERLDREEQAAARQLTEIR